MIRVAQLDDSNGVLALCREFVTSFELDELVYQESYTRLLSSTRTHFVVAETESKVVGYLLGNIHLTLFANGPVAWVDEVMVHESCRRQGVGERLMQSFEKWAKDREAKMVALATRRAAPFYLALGYEESATYFRKTL